MSLRPIREVELASNVLLENRALYSLRSAIVTVSSVRTPTYRIEPISSNTRIMSVLVSPRIVDLVMYRQVLPWFLFWVSLGQEILKIQGASLRQSSKTLWKYADEANVWPGVRWLPDVWLDVVTLGFGSSGDVPIKGWGTGTLHWAPSCMNVYCHPSSLCTPQCCAFS